MLLIRILTYIKGFVRISVAGRFVERYLNICMNRDIYVWDIKNRGSELLHMNMTVEGFKQIPPVAFKSKTRVKILSKHGLPFVLQKYKRRKGFVVAGIAAAVLFAYITSFVWVIDIEGNEKVSTDVIMSALENNGFKTGVFRYGRDISALQNKLLLEVDGLSWIWVEINGTRATVQVKEKVPVPHIVDRDLPCNLVAAADGLVTEVKATYGEKMVSVGDVVKKGDLLVSGISDTKYGGIQYLHSSGSIKARTWHSKSGDFPLVKINFSKTGKKISKKTINFFGFRVKLYLRENLPFEFSEEEAKIHRLSIGENLVIPISLESATYHELLKSEEPLTEEQAAAIACTELGAQLDGELAEGTVIVSKTHEVAPAAEGQISVKLNYECIEEIGTEVPIEVAETTDAKDDF